MSAARNAQLLATAMAGVIALTSCSFDPTRLPVPGSYSAPHTYKIRVEFSSVLNLPARAKVDSGGVQVGVLDRVELADATAVAYLDIDAAVALPQNTRVELRQSTVLGDIYVALITPTDRAAISLHDGDTIPLSNTAPADNIEDVLRSVSSLVAGGALNTLQDTVISINKGFPQDPEELTRIQHKFAGALKDLASNQDTIDQILSSTENISANLKANATTFDRLVTEGPGKLNGLGSVTLNIVGVIIDGAVLGRAAAPVLNPITGDLIQMLSYVTPFIGSVATADTTVPVIADKLVELIRDRLIPFFSDGGPRFTVSSVDSPDSSLGLDPAARADEVISAMRTMGLIK